MYGAMETGRSWWARPQFLATLYSLCMATQRIEERKARDRQARRTQIIAAARQIAGSEGWPNVTVRRLSDEISYSQPVLYSHFSSRDSIIAAVAIEGFNEIGVALEKARQKSRRGHASEAVASAYLEFANASPSLYEAMYSLNLSVPFDEADTPPELRFAFDQILGLFSEQGTRAPVFAELFWASLHGIAELTRTKRFPPKRQKERIRMLVEVFGAALNNASGE